MGTVRDDIRGSNRDCRVDNFQDISFSLMDMEAIGAYYLEMRNDIIYIFRVFVVFRKTW